MDSFQKFLGSVSELLWTFILKPVVSLRWRVLECEIKGIECLGVSKLSGPKEKNNWTETNKQASSRGFGRGGGKVINTSKYLCWPRLLQFFHSINNLHVRQMWLTAFSSWGTEFQQEWAVMALGCCSIIKWYSTPVTFILKAILNPCTRTSTTTLGHPNEATTS